MDGQNAWHREKRKITLLGCGLGTQSLTLEALEALRGADLLFGAPRLLEEARSLLGDTRAKFFPYYTAREISEVLNQAAPGLAAVVLLSGDSGFFSAGAALSEAFADEDCRLLPGISCLSGFFARLGLPWQDVEIQSLHGRRGNPVDLLRREKRVFFLLGKDEEREQLLAELCAAGFGSCPAALGENLGLSLDSSADILRESEGQQPGSRERIQRGLLSELRFAEPGSLAVLTVENPAADARVRTGLPDTAFIRGKVPMTKAEVRALIMSKLALAPDDRAADIGAGTGSVTVEMALAAWKGRIYAIEREPEGIELIRRNLRAFQVGNVEIIDSEAPDKMETLPPLNAAFIGGSGGRLEAIVAALCRNNPKIRLLFTAITLETLEEARHVLSAHGFAIEVTQLAVTRATEMGRYHLLRAENPIFLISGRPEQERESQA